MTNRWILLTGTILLASSLLLGGCPTGTTDPPADQTGKNALKPFNSADEIVQYFRQQAQHRFVSRGGGPLGFLFPPMAAGAAEDNATQGEAADGQASYSTTNVQEVGVDESDVFKNDGTHFYIAKGKTIRIVSATPFDGMTELGTVELDAYVDSLYLDPAAHTLIALAQQYNYDAPSDVMPMIWPPYFRGAAVLVYQIDVTDPAAPAIVGQNEVDGSLVTSRVTGGRLILILTISPPIPDTPTLLTINQMDFSDVQPSAVRGDGTAEPLILPGDWYHPEFPDGYNTTAVVTLDAADVETIVGSSAVMANAGTIYSSTEALYITDTTYDPNDNFRETTTIHKFAFDADGVARYSSTGTVPGRLLNQFSLGEAGDYLRLATHVNNWQFWIGGPMWEAGVAGVAIADDASPVASSSDDAATTQSDPNSSDPAQPFNAVYVLKETADTLEVVGSLENIAPGEDLYSARFMGDRAYLVTFVRIDPLFVIDLAIPEAPAILGELELPGWSDYLHVWGDDRLIGVGRSTVNAPWGLSPGGVQVSLFDISDPADPALVDQVQLGDTGSWCDVSNSHKAFTFMENRGLLALPVELWHNGVPGATNAGAEWWGGINFSGVVAFQLERDAGFTPLGEVESVVYSNYGWNPWRRAAVIGDALYAITTSGVRAVDLAHFDAPAALELTPAADEFDGGWQGPWFEGETRPSGGAGQAL